MRIAAALVTALAMAVMFSSSAAASIPTQDSARATGNAPLASGGGTFNIDISAQSGPRGENPTGHASFNLGSPSGLLVAGPVTCLSVSGNTAFVAFDDTFSSPVVAKLVDGGAAGAGLDRFDTFLSSGSSTNCGFQSVLGDVTVLGGDVVVIDAPPLPTTRDECKNGGWRTFPGFKNQGQCVAFVERGPKR